MSTDVKHVELGESLAAAVETMLRAGIGSVVVTREGSPAGILTETDALIAAVETDEPFSAIPVSRAATTPPETIRPTATVRAAADRMVELGVKKLLVVDGMELRGIVTMTDLVEHQGAFIRETLRIERERDGWRG
ncbi:CBS domain-containing protein [Halorubrum vacuolatum]|nr:CBS domain-containing protein [Halorubrum vacuolatum]